MASEIMLNYSASEINDSVGKRHAHSNLSTVLENLGESDGKLLFRNETVKGDPGATGATGATGAAGADAYTVILTNEAVVFPAGISAATAGSTTSNVIAFKGATQVVATIGTISGQVTGLTTSITSNGTTSAYFTVTVTTSLTTKSGTLTVPITVDGKSFTKKFSWSLALTGATGATGATGPAGPNVTTDPIRVFRPGNLLSGVIDTGQLEVRNSLTGGVEGSGAAAITFHRSGAHAVNFGLANDNRLKVGGYSMGEGNEYDIYHAGYYSGNAYSVGFGIGALIYNSGDGNTGVGAMALLNNTSGFLNTAVGRLALENNTIGHNNVGIGAATLRACVSGGYNIAVGPWALESYTGSSNTAVGYIALQSTTIGGYNVGIGHASLQSNTQGGGNVAVGYDAGRYLTDGASANISSTISVYLGYNTRSINWGTNQIVIGYNASPSASNQITLGNTAITSLRCNVTSISALSDVRIKEDIKPADRQTCLDAVMSLPVNRYKYKDFTGVHLDTHVTGWLADDVEKVFPKAVQYADEYFPELDEDGERIKETVTEEVRTGVDEDGEPIFETHTREIDKMFLIEGVKNITMSEATPTLWGAVQRLYEIVQEQAEEIKLLKGMVA